MENEVEMEPQVQVGSRVNVVEEKDTFAGVVTNIGSKGRYHVDFDDGDTGDYPVGNLTVISEETESPTAPPTAPPETSTDPASEETVDEATELTEAELLGVPKSKVKLAGFKGKKGITPEMVTKEKAKHAKLAEKRQENRVIKAKAKAKEKPVEARRKLLVARLSKIRNKRQATNYSPEQVKVWVQELEFINKTPEAWKPGCIKAKGQSLDDKINAVLGVK